jgi:hypothetical protein
VQSIKISSFRVEPS